MKFSRSRIYMLSMGIAFILLIILMGQNRDLKSQLNENLEIIEEEKMLEESFESNMKELTKLESDLKITNSNKTDENKVISAVLKGKNLSLKSYKRIEDSGITKKYSITIEGNYKELLEFIKKIEVDSSQLRIMKAEIIEQNTSNANLNLEVEESE